MISNFFSAVFALLALIACLLAFSELMFGTLAGVLCALVSVVCVFASVGYAIAD